MTHLKYPVLASLALLGACSYEVTLWSSGGGGEQMTFDASKVAELVKIVARERLGEPTAVRCPPKMQFVSRDRYTCQFDFGGATYDVWVRHGVFMNARAGMISSVVGYEPLARDIEATFDGKGIDADCTGVVISVEHLQGRCALADGRAVEVDGSSGQVAYKIVEVGVSPM